MRTRHIGSSLFAVGAALAVSACGLTSAQNDAALKFADAATHFGDAAATEITQMRDQTVAMNTALYRVPDLPANDRNGAKPIVEASIDDKEYANLADYFSSDWYTIFLSGPVAMKAYGTALTTMLNADNSAQVKAASDNLAAALKAIPSSPAANASSAAISGLSQQLTEWVLADMKAHAVRTAVAGASGAVTEICARVADDFAAKPDAKNLPWRFKETAEQLYAASEQGMLNNKNQPTTRADSLQGYVLAKSNLDDATKTFPQIVTAGNGCKSANAALGAALNDDAVSTKDIEDFYNEMKGLYANGKILAETK